MRKKYLKSMTAHVIMATLSLLCLIGHQTVAAQNLNHRAEALSGGSSAANASSPQKAVMPPMTKSGGNAILVNGDEYDTWEKAVEAINESSEDSFNIVLQKHVLDAKTMPNKPCTISGTPASINFAYVNDAGKLTLMQMLAPLTFTYITLDVLQISANGHALTFDKGVKCATKYNDTDITGIWNIWGGTDNTVDVESTNITIKSGSFGWVYGGSVGTGNVSGTSTVTVTGGTINRTIFGGSSGGTCGNTEVTMTGGSTCWIYGGGEQGNVTDTAKLTISGTALITEDICGGSNSGTCGSTNVVINGGTIKKDIFAGGYHGDVTGLSSIEVNGANIDPDLVPGSSGSYMGGSIYGGGFGDANNRSKGKVGSTKVVIKGIASGGENLIVYGGGQFSQVTGNTDVTIEGGVIKNVYASGCNYNPTNLGVKGNVNLLIKGGTIERAGAARGQLGSDVFPVTGTMNITIEGGVVTKDISSGNEAQGKVYKECTLTVKNMGSENNPYTLPCIITMTNLVLDKSVVKLKRAEPGDYNLYGFTLKEDHPVTISGDGKLVGTKIPINTITGVSLFANKPLIVAENLPAATTFETLVRVNYNTHAITPIYKAGKTYRRKDINETLYTVGITAPEKGLGTVSVKWGQYNSEDVMLEDGDQVPASADITPEVTRNDDGVITATLKNGEAEITSGEELTLSADAAFSAEFEVLSLDMDSKNDITISKVGKIWKYTEAAITKATDTSISFNGTIKGTLPDGKRILIEATAQEALTFDDAKINSSSIDAPALTIASGAKVSFSGTLEVQTANADQYGILNNGSLTITGNNTTVKAINSTADSNKGIKVDAAASMAVEAGATLTTSGMANNGTVVVKKGATAETTDGVALEKVYLVTVTDPGNGNLVIKAGDDIEVNDQDKVSDKAALTVSGVPDSGYTLESITATPEGGQAATISNNGLYTMPESAVAFAATFRRQTPPAPPAPTYHSISLPTVEGATTDPVAGIYQIENWSNFRFTLTLDKDYDQSVPTVTTSRGETITPNVSDGAYVVTYVRDPVVISISGIVKNTPVVGNASVDADGTKVWSVGSTLYIHTLSKESVRITSFGGALLRQFITPGGDYQTQMPEGVYIIQVGEGRFKVKM